MKIATNQQPTTKENKMTNSEMTIKASDLGIWRPMGNDGLRWKWLSTDAHEIVLVDRRVQGDSQKALTGSSTFRLEITESSAIYEDGYRVTTCGSSGKGATRHHEFKTMAEAQAYALKWLDYRVLVQTRLIDFSVGDRVRSIHMPDVTGTIISISETFPTADVRYDISTPWGFESGTLNLHDLVKMDLFDESMVEMAKAIRRCEIGGRA